MVHKKQTLSMSSTPFSLPRLLSLGVCALVAFARGELRPESDLTNSCFDFPRQNFDPENSIYGVNDGKSPQVILPQGEIAIDFTLHDMDGNPWRLRDALQEEGLPVVMVWGMFTCPAYQGYDPSPPWDKCSYFDEYNLVEEYQDRATFVHLYGPEPHPVIPGTNFDQGIFRPMPWSVVNQPLSYEERLNMAAKIVNSTHPSQVILPDYLPGNPYSDQVQPVWCSYVLGARGVTIVAPPDKVLFQAGWFHAGHVAHALDGYWAGVRGLVDDEDRV